MLPWINYKLLKTSMEQKDTAISHAHLSNGNVWMRYVDIT